MARTHICGWELGTLSEGFTTGGTVSVQSTTKRTGNYALRINPTATTGAINVGRFSTSNATVVTSASTNASDVLHLTFWTNVTTGPGAALLFVLARNSSNVIICRIELNPDKSLSVYRMDTANVKQLIGSTSALSAGWHKVLLSIDNTTRGSATISMTLDTEAAISASSLSLGNTGNQVASMFQFGSGGTDTTDYYIDDIIFDDATAPGNNGIRMMKPDGAGTAASWTDGTGTTFAEVDEVPHDSSSTYIGSTNTGNIVHDFAFESTSGAGISGTIACVSFVSFHGAFLGGGGNIRAYVNSTATGPTHATGSGSYALNGHISLDDPADAAAWTTAKLDALTFGYFLVSNTTQRRLTALGVMVESPNTVVASLSLAVTAGGSTATLSPLKTTPKLALSQADGVATATLSPLNSPTKLQLGQVDGLSTATMQIVDRQIVPGTVEGLSTATLQIADKNVFPDAVAGLSTATLAPLSSPALMAMAADGLSAATLEPLTSPALLALSQSDGVATAIVVVVTPSYITLSSTDGVATASLALSVLYRARLRMGGGIVVLKKSSAGVVVKTRNQAGVVVRGAKLGAGYVV